MIPIVEVLDIGEYHCSKCGQRMITQEYSAPDNIVKPDTVFTLSCVNSVCEGRGRLLQLKPLRVRVTEVKA
jgi:hypothetical protein